MMEDLIKKVITLRKEFEEKQQPEVNFNIFQIMGMEYSEVYTHSAIIGALLDPYGSHNLKDKFLQLFLNRIDITGFNTHNIVIEIEKSIGPINDDYTVGGRIDIIISNKEKILIIENKINAVDQKKQLLRYYNYAKNIKGKEYQIIYLSKFEDKPSIESYVKKDVLDLTKLITYKTEVKEWIEECIKSIENKDCPYILEILKQYLKTIKTITLQTMDTQLENNVIDALIESPFTFKAGLDIGNSISDAKTKIFKEIVIPIVRQLFNDGIGFSQHNKQYCFCFYKENWLEQNICISFEFAYYYSNCSYGIRQKDSTIPNSDFTLSNIIIELGVSDGGTTPEWPYWKWISKELEPDYFATKFWTDIIEDRNANKIQDYKSSFILKVKEIVERISPIIDKNIKTLK